MINLLSSVLSEVKLILSIYTVVQIILLVISKSTYAVATLCRLFDHVKESASAPLFMLSNAAFSQFSVISILKARLAEAGFSFQVIVLGKGLDHMPLIKECWIVEFKS